MQRQLFQLLNFPFLLLLKRTLMRGQTRLLGKSSQGLKKLNIAHLKNPVFVKFIDLSHHARVIAEQRSRRCEIRQFQQLCDCAHLSKLIDRHELIACIFRNTLTKQLIYVIDNLLVALQDFVAAFIPVPFIPPFLKIMVGEIQFEVVLVKELHSLGVRAGDAGADVLVLHQSYQKFQELVSHHSPVWFSRISSLGATVGSDELEIQVLLFNEGEFESGQNSRGLVIRLWLQLGNVILLGSFGKFGGWKHLEVRKRLNSPNIYNWIDCGVILVGVLDLLVDSPEVIP